MRRTQKILIGLFLGGVLLCGIGTGVAMVEYSSLTYAGEKLLGEEHLVTEDFDFSFDLDGRPLILCSGYCVDEEVLEHVVSDSSIPAGTVRYEITYNKEELTPVLHFEEEYEEAESEISKEMPDVTEGETAEETDEEETGTEDTGTEETGAEETETEKTHAEETETEETEAEPNVEEEPKILGRLYLMARYDQGYNGFKLVMENKDQFLEDLKQKKISSYDVAGITNVTVKASPETMQYLKPADWY